MAKKGRSSGAADKARSGASAAGGKATAGASAAGGKLRAGANAAKGKAQAVTDRRPGAGSKFQDVSWSRPGYVDGNSNGDMPWNPGWKRGSRWRWLTPLIGLIAIIIAALWGINHIENDVEAAAPQILAQNDIDPSGLTFDASYRNVEVDGVLPAGVTAEQIEEILEENNFEETDDDNDENDGEGEDIRNASVIAVAAAAQAFGAIDVDVDSDGEVIMLTGTVPSEAHEAELIAAAEATGLRVEEDITVTGLEPSADDADAQIGRMAGVIGGLGVGTFVLADLMLGDDGPVTGRIEALDTAGANTFTGLVDGEDVGVSAPPDLAPLDVDVRYDGTRIVLNGTVFSEDERDALAASAAEVVGEENVVNNLEISELDAAVEGSPARVDALAAAIGTFGGLQSADGSLNDTDLTINGVANDEATRATSVGALEAAADAELRPGGEITVPEAPEISLDEEVELLQAELDALQDEIRENVVFDSNSAELTPLAQGTLDKVAAAMTRFSRPVVEVGGHTDSVGPDDFNIDLSQRRTDSVQAYLTSQGIDLGRLQAVGFGEANPIADNLTEEGRLQNRRVEFIARSSFDG